MGGLVHALRRSERRGARFRRRELAPGHPGGSSGGHIVRARRPCARAGEEEPPAFIGNRAGRVEGHRRRSPPPLSIKGGFVAAHGISLKACPPPGRKNFGSGRSSRKNWPGNSALPFMPTIRTSSSSGRKNCAGRFPGRTCITPARPIPTRG